MTGYTVRPVLVGIGAGALLGGVAVFLGARSDWVLTWVLLGPWYLADLAGGGTRDWSLYLSAAAYFSVFGGMVGYMVTGRLSKGKLVGALLLVLSGHAAMSIAGADRFSRVLHNMGPLPAEAIPGNIFSPSPTGPDTR